MTAKTTAEQRAAAAELLNRGYGKATQMIAGDGADAWFT